MFGACGSDPHQGSPQAAACFFTSSYKNGATVGLCTQLCNCNADCLAPGMICESWAQAGASNPAQFAATFKKEGYCAPSVWVADAGITGIATCSQDGGVDAQ